MRRKTIQNAADMKRMTLQEATDRFIKHCKVKNLREQTIAYYPIRNTVNFPIGKQVVKKLLPLIPIPADRQRLRADPMTGPLQ